MFEASAAIQSARKTGRASGPQAEVRVVLADVGNLQESFQRSITLDGEKTTRVR
jgi:hypothetical protein